MFQIKYQIIDNFRGDHTEVLKIDYDPEKISFNEILHLFWNNHEYGLSGKIKRQYMSVIFYQNEKEKLLAEVSKQEEQLKRKPEIIATEIRPASTFYPAEEWVIFNIFWKNIQINILLFLKVSPEI